jgi:cytochrome P450
MAEKDRNRLTSPAAASVQVDPYDEEFQQRPFPFYERLRSEAPVYRIPGQDWYMVTRMDLIREALRDPATFANGVTRARRSLPPPEVMAEVEAIRAQGYRYQPALGLSDPPVHTRYRRLINRAFTPRALTWMEPLVADVARELADALVDGATVDIIDAITRPLPIYAILRILGLGDERRVDVARWSDAATASLGAKLTPQRWIETEWDILDFQQVISAELDERRRNPRQDLLSTVVSDASGEPFGNGELVWLIRELLVAGNETTTRAMAEIILQLDKRPGAWRQIRDDPTMIPGIVEEGIRIAAPAIGMFREVRSNTTLGGVDLPAGTTIYLVYGSGNRDEDVFPEPDQFDPTRKNLRDHLSFGHGIHVCVGAGLARMESAATLRALADTVDYLHVDPDVSLKYIPSFFIRGLLELPVTVQKRAPITCAAPTAGLSLRGR